MQVNIKIQRFNPEQDKKPYWKTYQVEAALNDQILDVLHQVKWYQDGTLTL
ncbi:MAG: 2Fe-2S iron-sulfur cluster-binding protein, partial [Anaerolineae bacterium]